MRALPYLSCLLIAALGLASLGATPLRTPPLAEVSPLPYLWSILRDCDARTVAPTGSMKPTLDERDWVIIAPPTRRPFAEVKVGQIIIYLRASDGWLICHRVIAVSSGHSALCLKGDANDASDPQLVDASAYQGTVVAIVRRPGL